MLDIDKTIRTTPVTNCYLCGQPGYATYGGLSDRLYGTPGEWSLSRCSNPRCRLMWLNPAPLPEDIGKAYQTYFTHEAPQDAQETIPSHRAQRLSWWITRAEREAAALSDFFLSDTKPGTLLEVGCGDGANLARFRDRGWTTLGQDVDNGAVTQARRRHGLEVRQGPLRDLHLEGDRFDAVVLSHVIEHLHNPVDVLEECRRVMRPGGKLVAVTPNSESLGHAYYGTNWRALEPPRHLLLFSRQTVAAVAKRAGFREVNTRTSAVRAFWVVSASQDIARTGRHRVGSWPGLATRAWAFLFQSFEILATRVNPALGEECILIAQK